MTRVVATAGRLVRTGSGRLFACAADWVGPKLKTMSDVTVCGLRVRDVWATITAYYVFTAGCPWGQ